MSIYVIAMLSSHVVFLQRICQAASGVITAVLVAVYLTPIEQGFYYTMGSLLSAYSLLDLGLSGLLVQVSARLFAGLRFATDGEVRPVTERAEFIAMMRWARRWYASTALIALVLLPIGWLYFHLANRQFDVSWQQPWLVIVLAVSLSMPAYPLLSVIEGAGKVTEIYLIRILHYTFAALLSWGMLVSGHGLYALAMMPLSVAVITLLWSRTRFNKLMTLCRDNNSQDGFQWKTRLWPLHRQVALVSVGNYIFLQCPVPVLFYLSGPKDAGRLGLSMLILNIISAISMSWFTASIPRMTRLVSEGKQEASRQLFIREYGRFMLIMSVLYGSLLAIVYGLPEIYFIARVLPFPELSVLMLTYLLTQSMSAIGGYFRAYGREVFALANISASLLALAIASALAASFGALGFLSGLAVAYLLILAPVLLWAWVKWLRPAVAGTI
ncbi:hypothetical protein F6R98_17260 [Candidatus Methylospira mobilis]|uniref:Oligosaccharide flippase family protein n=1 Tax=Candidatus Methylospira mobilis TaxID=1808979 RepID=A0A5Q0BQ10_9GAMM|nr:hypothetical protein [Candidatus Methylospira mobilis]QFY44168.1 hypothetical protein F6R98_17260 [Candidatus Methylospira mobilis]WNV06412.1 hypothetical protein RP726_08410 [Candidatus Methylospira mobilis]